MPRVAHFVAFDCTRCGARVSHPGPVRGSKPHWGRKLCGPCKSVRAYAMRLGKTLAEYDADRQIELTCDKCGTVWLHTRRQGHIPMRCVDCAPPKRWNKSSVGQIFDCQLCGAQFVKRYDNHKYCSPDCARVAARDHGVKTVHAPCEWCGKPLTRKRYKKTRRLFCGRRCQMAYKVCVTDGLASREWPRLNPWQYVQDRRDYIIERDGGRCLACRKKVVIGNPRHPRAAEIDHIIPVSLWPKDEPGMNDPSNLRLLCRSCNSAKSNRTAPGGDQLMLIG